MFILFMVVPHNNVNDLQVGTKGELWSMFLEEYIRTIRTHPHRFVALGPDLSNCRAVAIELGYPTKIHAPGRSDRKRQPNNVEQWSQTRAHALAARQH